jgi:hypothetical protein
MGIANEAQFWRIFASHMGEPIRRSNFTLGYFSFLFLQQFVHCSESRLSEKKYQTCIFALCLLKEDKGLTAMSKISIRSRNSHMQELSEQIPPPRQVYSI